MEKGQDKSLIQYGAQCMAFNMKDESKEGWKLLLVGRLEVSTSHLLGVDWFYKCHLRSRIIKG